MTTIEVLIITYRKGFKIENGVLQKKKKNNFKRENKKEKQNFRS